MTTFIERLMTWIDNNRLVAHNGKSKLVLFTLRPCPPTPDIEFYNCYLEWVSSVKYLGLILDNKLSFCDHINSVNDRISRARGMIYSVSHILPRTSLLTLYYSLVYPHLVYLIIIWGGVPHSCLSHLLVNINNILRNYFKCQI